MIARTLQLAVPSLAMAVVGFALFGPGAVRSFDGAEIWGGPTDGVDRWSFRALGVERFRGIDSTKDLGEIVVSARAENGVQASARCRTRRDGTCDIELPLAMQARGVVHADVTTSDGRLVLASGDLTRGAKGWDAGPGHPPRITGSSHGDLAIEVAARRGVFAAPFRDELVVTVKQSDAPVARAHVTLRADAVNLAGALGSDASATIETSNRGEAIFALEPLTHTVEATVEVSAAGLAASWDGVLPVMPGAIWLDPAGLAAGELRVTSPVPRDLVYATLSSRSARLWCGVISLASDARGFAVGAIAWPIAERERANPVWLTLSSDPRGSGLGTVGWPVNQAALAEGELPFRDWLLLDGMPAAERRDAERRGRARRLAASALGAAAVIEGVLLARGSYGKGARSWIWLVIAIATVALAFAALGLVAMWRTG